MPSVEQVLEACEDVAQAVDVVGEALRGWGRDIGEAKGQAMRAASAVIGACDELTDVGGDPSGSGNVPRLENALHDLAQSAQEVDGPAQRAVGVVESVQKVINQTRIATNAERAERSVVRNALNAALAGAKGIKDELAAADAAVDTLALPCPHYSFWTIPAPSRRFSASR